VLHHQDEKNIRLVIFVVTVAIQRESHGKGALAQGLVLWVAAVRVWDVQVWVVILPSRGGPRGRNAGGMLTGRVPRKETH
jgi:hypothetical protein